MRRAAWFRIVGCVLVAVIVGAAYGAVMTRTLRDRYHGNYSGFLQISRERFDNNPLMRNHPEIRRSLVLIDGPGYDAQLMYYETFDPFLRAFDYRPFTYQSVVDAPTYRYGRIGFSLLTKIFSGNRWRRYPPTMIWLILSSLSLAALLLALTALQNGASPASGLLIALVPGFWQSLQAALPEPIAAAMLIGGSLCVLRREWVLAGVCFAISLLIRETGVILVACLVVACLRSGERTEALRLGLIATVPVIAWRLYVAKMLFPAYGAQAFFMNPEDLGVPFRGFVDLWTTIVRGAYFPGAPEMARAGTWYPIVLTAGFVVSLVMALRVRNAITAAALLYATLAISLNFGIWESVGNGVRGTYELFIALALASTHIGTQARALRAGLATFWTVAAAYVVVWAPDAAYLRDSVVWASHHLWR